MKTDIDIVQGHGWQHEEEREIEKKNLKKLKCAPFF
jgi:hypothetical protein